MKQNPILIVNNLKKYFSIRSGPLWKETGKIYAVDGVSFSINHGETVGLVGESGCGKTTLGRTIMALYKPTYGSVTFKGLNIKNTGELKQVRRNMQMIFQDPYESLNPRYTIEKILEEPYIIHRLGSKKERRKKVLDLLDKVGLNSRVLSQYPHEFSGGQRQRIGIARAIALNPELLVCDEPVSALDVSIQSQILNLLLDLQQKLKLSYLFIAHDLAVVRQVSDRIAVMYLGKIVEYSDADYIYDSPLHPYTKALISAILLPDPHKKKNRIILHGEIPSPANPPAGCSFHTRCPYAKDICMEKEPELREITANHIAACHRIGEI